MIEAVVQIKAKENVHIAGTQKTNFTVLWSYWYD